MDVAAYATKGNMQDEDLSPQHQSGGKCMSEHSTRRLETSFGHQCRTLWVDLSLLRA